MHNRRAARLSRGLGGCGCVANEGANLCHQRVWNLRQAMALARVDGHCSKNGIIGVIVKNGGAPGNDVTTTESLQWIDLSILLICRLSFTRSP